MKPMLPPTLCLACSALLAIATTIHTAASPPAITDTEPLHTIPFDDSANWVIVPVEVGESEPLRCILDTGMPSGLFLFDPALGERLGLSYVATVPVKGAGNATVTAGLAMGQTLSLGNLEFDNQRVIVLTESGGLAEMGIDGVIGATVFNEFIVEFQFDQSTIALHQQEAPNRDRFGKPIPMTVTATKPFIDASVRNAEGDEVGVTLLIDSGANTGIDLYPATIDGFEYPEASISKIVASGVGGNVTGVAGRLDGLRMGGFEFDNLVAGFSDNPVGSENGVIGMDTLRRFIPTFDYANEELRLRPSAEFNAPSEFNMAGLQLRPHDGGGLFIRNVIDGSPAADEGIREGDVLKAINGEPIEPGDEMRFKKRMQEDGASIRLTLLRDGATFDVTCTLRRLI